MKKPSRAGSVLVIGCFLCAAVFALLLLVADVGRFDAARNRAETIAQASVLGSLRMRIDGLTRVAERWNNIGAKLGTVDVAGHVFVRSDDASSVASAARSLSSALSGYQARTKSIITVLAQSNAVPRDRITSQDDSGSRLDVRARPAVTVSETGALTTVDALWYQRGWALDNDTSDPAGAVRQAVAFVVSPLSRKRAAWSATALAQGEVRWNRSEGGNGGYPRNWTSAVVANRLNPHRTASYRAVLTEPNP